MEIRRARATELAELCRIQLRALQLDDMLARLQPDEVPALFHHGLESGEILVAQAGEQLLGFAVGYERDGTWFLGEFFVNPDSQSAGIGQALLAALKPEDLPCATMTTSDYRAQALYARAGMTPLWPSFNLQAPLASLNLPSHGDVAIVPATDMLDIQRWDAEISGRRRETDLQFFIDKWNGGFVWLTRAGERVGYAGIAQQHGGRVGIGPVGVRAPNDARAGVLAVLAWAARLPRVQSLRLDLAGIHPALPELLAGGFRITDQNIFCASAPARFGRPDAYIPMTPALY